MTDADEGGKAGRLTAKRGPGSKAEPRPPARAGRPVSRTPRSRVSGDDAGPGDRLPRQPGALRGRIRMAPDFDALPPEMLAAMSGRED